MDHLSPEFPLFTTFPKEIRLQIWKESLPEPRIIDLKLLNSEGLNYAFAIATGCNRNGPWFWTTNSLLPLPLLQVNHEARRSNLESYTPTTLRQENSPVSRVTYIDFNKDTIYRSCVFPDQLFKFDQTYSSMVSNTSSWSCNTTKLALDFSIFQTRRHPLFGEWLASFHSPETESRKHALRVLLVVCVHFPAIKNLYLVIDGRDERFGGKIEIVDPEKLPGDVLHHIFREKAIQVLELVVGDLRRQRPDVMVPKVGIRLFMNGEDTEELERRWSYDKPSCGFVDPRSVQPLRFFRSADDSDSSSEDEDAESDIRTQVIVAAPVFDYDDHGSDEEERMFYRNQTCTLGIDQDSDTE